MPFAACRVFRRSPYSASLKPPRQDLHTHRNTEVPTKAADRGGNFFRFPDATACVTRFGVPHICLARSQCVPAISAHKLYRKPTIERPRSARSDGKLRTRAGTSRGDFARGLRAGTSRLHFTTRGRASFVHRPTQPAAEFTRKLGPPTSRDARAAARTSTDVAPRLTVRGTRGLRRVRNSCTITPDWAASRGK